MLAADGTPTGIDVVYLVVGKFTSRLAQLIAGQRLEVWGPLGNGFAPRFADHLVMVAGGIGQTPFLAPGREYLGNRKFGGLPGPWPPNRSPFATAPAPQNTWRGSPILPRWASTC